MISKLFKWNRFDLPAKYLYAKFRQNKINSDFGLEIYKEHLKLWNGFKEFDNPNKNTFEAFKLDFDNLIDDINSFGFDGDKSKIVIDEDGYLVNGAHRTVACVVNNEEGVFQVGGVGQKVCDHNMFRNMGLSEFYMDAMAYELSKLNTNMFVVSIFPRAVGSENEVENILDDCGNIAYKKIVKLNPNGAFNLMRQMYYGEEWAGEAHNNWPGLRSKASLCFTNDNPLKVYLVEFDNVDIAQETKLKIRDIFKIQNHSVHINDTHEETIRLARVLLNDNSIHFMNNSDSPPYQSFQEQLNYFKNWIIQNGLDIEDYCVSASSILSMYGLREGYDLDYLHNGLVIQGHNMVHSHNEYGIDKYHTHRDDIIYNPSNHFYYDDIKFASLDVVKQLKQKRMEQKDIKDIKLIDGVINV
jgi:hypothetical protein